MNKSIILVCTNGSVLKVDTFTGKILIDKNEAENGHKGEVRNYCMAKDFSILGTCG